MKKTITIDRHLFNKCLTAINILKVLLRGLGLKIGQGAAEQLIEDLRRAEE